MALSRIIVPELENHHPSGYKYLVNRPHPWRRQLCIRGRKILPSRLYFQMLVNNLTKEQVATDWNLPIETVDEIIAYCEANDALLKAEAKEELARIQI